MKKASSLKGASIAELYSRFGIILILFIALIAGAILSPSFLVPSNLISVAQNVGVYAIIALGMTRLLIGAGVDLSAGSNVAMCSVVVAVIFQKTGSTVLGMLLALVVGGFIGAINGFFVSYIGLMPFIVTLATQMTVRGLAYLLSGGAPVFGVSDAVVYMAQGKLFGIPVMLLIVLAATVIVAFVMSRTSHGRYLYAIGGNAEAAGASGINVNRVIRLVYVLDGITCAIGAILFMSRINSGDPAAGAGSCFDAITAVCVGGVSIQGGQGGVIGTLLGGAIVGILRNVLNLMNINANWQDVISGLVILIAVSADMFVKNSLAKNLKK